MQCTYIQGIAGTNTAVVFRYLLLGCILTPMCISVTGDLIRVFLDEKKMGYFFFYQKPLHVCL